MKKIANFLSNSKAKIGGFVASAALTASLAMNQAMAYSISTTTVTNKAKSLADILTYIFPLMGGFFVLSGAIKWVMAFRSEQPEQQAAAVKELIIGLVCVVFKAFLWKPISNVVFGA